MGKLGKFRSRGTVTLPRALRQAAGIEPGDTVFVRAAGPGKVEITLLPRMSVAEMLEKYAIDGPVDFAADREKWEELAAKEMLGRLSR